MDVKIEASWKLLLSDEFDKVYFKQIVTHLKTERELGRTIYPAGSKIFNAFDLTPFENVKVIILGQDPYHEPNQAMGLSFSVPDGIPVPPSLVNIYKELKADIGMDIPKSGDLTNWAKQGVLLLNAALTVRAAEANSHANIGWHLFTDAVIKKISEESSGKVFLLWGSFAQAKQVLIDQTKHKILKAPHPSPLSAHRGFLGCKHFSAANNYLMQTGQLPIDWHL